MRLVTGAKLLKFLYMARCKISGLPPHFHIVPEDLKLQQISNPRLSAWEADAPSLNKELIIYVRIPE